MTYLVVALVALIIGYLLRGEPEHSLATETLKRYLAASKDADELRDRLKAAAENYAELRTENDNLVVAHDELKREREVYRGENVRLRRVIDEHFVWLTENLLDAPTEQAFDNLFDLCEQNGFSGGAPEKHP